MRWSLVLLPAVLVSGCAGQKQLYQWGEYQPALLSYTKTGESEKFEERLRETIVEGEEENRVPPGVYAELGFLLLHDNRPAEAVVFFQKERTAFPESTILMDKMILGATSASEQGEDNAS